MEEVETYTIIGMVRARIGQGGEWGEDEVTVMAALLQICLNRLQREAEGKKT